MVGTGRQRQIRVPSPTCLLVGGNVSSINGDVTSGSLALTAVHATGTEASRGDRKTIAKTRASPRGRPILSWAPIPGHQLSLDALLSPIRAHRLLACSKFGR